MEFDSVIDIFNLTPTTVSRDLQNKFILLYGKAKIGKSTFASKLKRNLYICTEAGVNALAGLTAVPCTSWSSFKKILMQLKRPEAHELYDAVTVDTVTLLWELCEKYICAQNSVNTIGELPYGRGYVLLRQEFESTLRQITLLNFGLILIAHSEVRTEKTGDGEETIEILRPALDKRCYAIVNQIVDIIGYIGCVFREDGTSERFLWTRESPTIFAGSRFPHLPAKIPFGYEELVKALAEAIEKQAQEGDIVEDNDQNLFQRANTQRPFSETMDEAKKLWAGKIAGDETKLEEINQVIKDVFGGNIKLSEATPQQQELLELVVSHLEKM